MTGTGVVNNYEQLSNKSGLVLKFVGIFFFNRQYVLPIEQTIDTINIAYVLGDHLSRLQYPS
jgi:hypothetical protein